MKPDKQYKVTGMTCAACAARVDKAARNTPGVTDCSVNLLMNTLTIEGTPDEAALARAIENAGYGLAGAEKATPGPERSSFPAPLIVSYVLLLVLMYLAMGGMLGLPYPAYLAQHAVSCGIMQLLLSGAILVLNRGFFARGFKAIFHAAPNMDTLVSLGSGISFVYSSYILIRMADGSIASHALYFESAAMILALIGTGKYLESRAKKRTTGAIDSLQRLAPPFAHVTRNGSVVDIPASALSVGDEFIVRPGESFPADGVVLKGEGSANESMLTGESMPVDKCPGSPVSQATVNGGSVLTCHVTKTGDDTMLARIIRSVNEAASGKAPIARLADKAAGIFVPVVLSIALVTLAVHLFLGHGFSAAVNHAITVLVISCPCSLGLATPVAIMTGTGRAAELGILFRSAAALEAAGRIRTICLDKTGTLTRGETRLNSIVPAPGVDEEELLRLCAALESGSEHPLARAVCDLACERHLPPLAAEDVRALAGHGLSGTVSGRAISILRPADAPEVLASCPALASRAADIASSGNTVACVVSGNALLGLLAFSDVLRDDAKDAIDLLRRHDILPVLLTGDDPRTAAAVAKELGITTVRAGMLPNDKAEAVRAFTASAPTAMAGDGINDAPSLASATLGIAAGGGTDVAVDAADVVLLNDRASLIASTLLIGRATLRNIRENLFWAVLYNGLLIPLAAGVIPSVTFSPMLGAAAMSLSSFCVVMNALRLKRFTPVTLFGTSADRKQNIKENKTMTKTMTIEGMMCVHCEARVKKTLEAIPGVTEASVSHTTGKAVVTLASDVPNEKLSSAVEAQDYKVISVE